MLQCAIYFILDTPLELTWQYLPIKLTTSSASATGHESSYILVGFLQ